jgi:hypothetical protein
MSVLWSEGAAYEHRTGRGDPPGREPVAGIARRGRDRQDGLLAYLVESVPELAVVWAVEVESEMELAYASLSISCARRSAVR